MPYPQASEEAIASFQEQGFLVVEDAIDPTDLAELEFRCQQVIEHPELYAYDWVWEEGRDLADREFKIIQAFPFHLWPDFMSDAPFRLWAIQYASALMGKDVEFWYDQFLAKPPATGAATLWHQDEAYWGRKIADCGITCWVPLQDVDDDNGCMHFIEGGHLSGVMEHQRPANVKSDLLYCSPDESRARTCPIHKGGVTFHHSKTPHMAGANQSNGWRLALTQHLRVVGSEFGDDYPWRVYVDQFQSTNTPPTEASPEQSGA